MGAFNRWLREVAPPVALALALVLAVTVVFFALSSSAARVGTLRAVSTIPEKGLDLVLIGAGVGLLACAAERRLDTSLLTLAVAFVALIAVDHLPSAFGVAQPIRPAHTFAFLALEIVALGVTFRGRPELVLLAVSAWFAHVAGDTGVFAFFAPLSFAYGPLGPYRVPFAIISVVFSIATGYVTRRTKGRTDHLAKEFDGGRSSDCRWRVTKGCRPNRPTIKSSNHIIRGDQEI